MIHSSARYGKSVFSVLSSVVHIKMPRRNRTIIRRSHVNFSRTLAKVLFLLFIVSTLSCSTIPDSKLQNDIYVRFNNTNGLQAVSVVVINGVATLSGTVANDSDKSLAETLAKVDGIKSINNNILVVPPTPQPTPEIAAQPDEAEEPAPSLYDEAFDEATKFVNEHSVNCDGVYYLLSNDSLWACKHPFEVEVDGKEFYPKELSEADKLNEIDPLPVQWEGSFKINMKLCRTMSIGPASYKTWSEWRDTDWHKPKHLKKAKGKWNIENSSDYGQGGKIANLNPSQCRAGSTIDIPGAFK